MGLLGLFGRSRNDLIRWQNLIYNKPSNILHTTERHLKEATPTIFIRHLEIAKDCAELFQSTANPEVFFSRYDSFIKECEFLLELSEFVELDCTNIPEQLQKAKEQYDEIVIDFIDRMWLDTCSKAEQLKTEKGQKNRYQKFYDALQVYEHRLPPRCIQHYQQLNNSQHDIYKTTTSSLATNTNSTDSSVKSVVPFSEEFELHIQGWHISISFGKSSSKNYSKALALAKAAPQYYEQCDNGNIIHQAFYSSKPKDFLAFIMLYELIESWKSTFVMINGELIDRKIVGKLKYCYGDKCRSNNPRFCYGASYFTENPFGCHRLQISAFNNPWWSFYAKVGNKYVLDQQALLNKINATDQVFHYCPCFDYDQILATFNRLPRILSANEMKKLENNPFYLKL